MDVTLPRGIARLPTHEPQRRLERVLRILLTYSFVMERVLPAPVVVGREDSFLSQVIDLVKQAQESKSKTQNLADTAAMWLTLVALGSGALTLAIWLFLMNHEFAFAVERAVTVMVITCPHALGLAVPLVVAATSPNCKIG